MQQKRRKLLKKLLLSAVSFGAGYGLSEYSSQESGGATLTKGEEWRNGKQLNTKDLAGLRPDGEVFTEAQKQIIRHRFSNFDLQLLQPNGEPLREVTVKLQQQHQTVDWGCSAAGSFVQLQKDEKDQERARIFANLFNCTTAKCYWDERWHQPIEHFEGLRMYDKFLDEVAWGKALGLKVKGHPLVWTVPKAIPKWMHQYPYHKQEQIWKEHVQQLVTIANGEVGLWDVCNEMLWEPTFKNIAKREWPHLDPVEEIAEYISLALQWAREIDPSAIYALNDYGLVNTYRPEISAGQQRQRYLALVEALKSRGILPDAIGCQSHVGGKFRLDAFKNALDDLAKAALPIQITEFWAHKKDFPEDLPSEMLAQARADYVCQMYTIAFAQPAVNHVTYWGSEVFFNKDGSPSLAYQQLHRLIKKEWLSNWQGQTDTEGKFSFEGFTGEYDLSFDQHPRTTIKLSFLQKGQEIQKITVR